MKSVKALKAGDAVTMTPWVEKIFKSRLAVEDPKPTASTDGFEPRPQTPK